MSNKEGLFGIVGGMRLGGKTTLAGTLPGKTLLLYADLLETGYKAAVALSKKKGNEVVPQSFSSLEELVQHLAAAADSDYDNIYIDSISAVTEMKLNAPDVVQLSKKSIWDAYREVGGSVRKLLLASKVITRDKGKNIFITLAYKTKLDANGNIAKIEPDCKGNVTIAEIQRLCPIVVAVDSDWDEDGNQVRKLRTASTAVLPARLDSLLDEDNPKTLDADLSVLVELLK